MSRRNFLVTRLFNSCVKQLVLRYSCEYNHYARRHGWHGLKTRVTAIFFAILLGAHLSFGQQAPDVAIAPFVDDQTLIVVRIDAGRVDPHAMLDWCTDRLAARQVARAGINAFRKSWQIRADRSSALLTAVRNCRVPYLYWILSQSDF